MLTIEEPGFFQTAFRALTGNRPFDWQVRLYERLMDRDIPPACDIPTGLGKTAIIPIWLIALAESGEGKGPRLPRRLVYVVNRRTVVDQATATVERMRDRLPGGEEYDGLDTECREMMDTLGRRLGRLAATDGDCLAISTLRGQFADNKEWSVNPSRPAVICGTVDMIGSRLLFGGYRIGFKSRPLHAGFLGQDALLVHDEAHLEPAFQKLIESIEKEQERERKRGADPSWPGMRVMALSATARSGGDNAQEEHDTCGLTDEEKQPPESVPDPPDDPEKEPPVRKVWRRLKAKKALHLHPCEDEKKDLAGQIADQALNHKKSGGAILVFVRRVDDVDKVRKELTDRKKGNVPADRVETLTGTMRGLERDGLIETPTFQRFLSDSPAEGTVYLICTSAGEVGVNLSADHMVCDLSTFDSMAQRLGRVNRFGDRDDTRVDVVHPGSFDDKEPNPQRERTLALLEQLKGDASPKALGELPADQRLAAFAPEPTILPATDILFDAWAMTTIRDAMPGRPPVAPYLHGIAEWEPPRTSVAWREEVEVITDKVLERHDEDFPQTLLEDYPLKPHELLGDTSDRILTGLQRLAANHPHDPAWIVDDQRQVSVHTLIEIADPAATKKPARDRLKQFIADGTVVLPPSVGGLTRQGTLDGDAEPIDAPRENGCDVADRWLDENGHRRRARVWDDTEPPQGMALIRTIDTDPDADEHEPSEGETESSSEDDTDENASRNRRRFWHWYARPRDMEDATRASTVPIKWQHHTDDVVQRTEQIVEALNLPDNLKEAIILAAELHDLGKKREQWQRSIGNPSPTDWHAKPGKPPRWRSRRLSDYHYRHEFGSLLDVLNPDAEHAAKLGKLSPEMRDVALHLIAAHHGYARPHFPPKAYDHERHTTQQNEDAAHETMRRYARLQREYGRWGLAYLESLLRAADWAASAKPSDAPSGSGSTS